MSHVPPAAAPRRASAVAFLALLLLLLAVAPSARAAVQTTPDPSDGLAGDGKQQSADLREVTWDDSRDGWVSLTVRLDPAPGRKHGLDVFLDTDEDGRSDYVVDVYPEAESLHPGLDGNGGSAVAILRATPSSTAQCALTMEADDDFGNPQNPQPGGWTVYPATLDTSNPAQPRTVYTIDIPRTRIGGASSFRWVAVGLSRQGGSQLYDFSPDAGNGVPDKNPAEGSFGESDDWYCSPDGGLAGGLKADLSKGQRFPDGPVNQAPTVQIGQQPELARPGQPVTLSAAASDPDGTVVSYDWDLDASQLSGDPDREFKDATGPTATTTFPRAGSYRVGVRVRDDRGATAFAYRTIEVAERAPTMTLSASNERPLKSEKFTVTADVASDSPVADDAIEWGFDADRAGDDDDPYDKHRGQSWTLGFGAPGTYVIKARVRNASGQTVTRRITITVPNQPPVFREVRVRAKKVPDDLGNRDPLVRGRPIILQAIANDDGLGQPVVEWDLDGDGSYDDATGFQVERTYPDAGPKTVAVRVTDDQGATAFGGTSFEVRESETAQCKGTAGDGTVRALGCFVPDPTDPDAKVSAEPVSFNGIDIEQKNGAKIKIGKDGSIATIGPGEVILRAGTTVLFQGRFNVKDPKCNAKVEDCLLTRVQAPVVANLKGFPLQGEVEIWATPRGGRVRVFVDVLGRLGFGLTARVEVLTRDGEKPKLDGLEIRTPLIPLGPKMTIGQFVVTYEGKTGRWTGSGNITLPTPSFTKLSADFAFSELTGFERARGEVDGLNIPLDLGTAFLQRIAFTIEAKGFTPGGSPRIRLGGGIGISAGPRVAGLDIATVDGDFLATFGDPFGLDVEGRISVAGFDVMGGTVTARSNGHVAAKGFIGFGLPFPHAFKGKRQDATKLKVSRFKGNGADVYNPLFQLVSVKGEASAWVEPQAFSLEASIFAKVIGINIVGGEGLLSSKGVAGCGQLLGIRGGFGYDYVTEKTDLFGSSCDLGKYEPVKQFAPLDDNGAGREATEFSDAGVVGSPRPLSEPRLVTVQDAAAPKATAIDVADGQKVLMLRLGGLGDDPVVALVDPSGRRYEMPRDGMTTQGGDFFSARHPFANVSYLGVRTPKAGRWQIVPAPGSAPLTTVRGAKVLPKPRVTATVRASRGGLRQTVRYRVRPIPGQRVTFVEQGTDTHRTVGVARGATGEFTFRPQTGAGRARKLEAVVQQFGKDRAHLGVARFTAVGLRTMRRPTSLRSRRAPRGSVAVEWDDRRGVEKYFVIARIGNGKTIARTTTCSRLIVPNVGPKEKVTFEVRAKGRLFDRMSRPATIRLKNRAIRTPTKAPYIPCRRP